MKILVTGAGGYLGQGIVKELLDVGCQVIASDYQLSQVDERAIKRPSDLFDINNGYEYYEKPDAILHLAWKDGFMHDSLRHIEQLGNHYRFLRNMVESGLQKVCILGSMHEIGFFEGSIHEHTPANPQSLYGISKNALRQSMQLLKREYAFVFQWIRGYYIVSNRLNGNSIFSKIAEAEKRGDKTFPFTMGINQYDFIDYKMFCRQAAAVMMQDKVAGIINCCSGIPMKLGDRVEQFIHENQYGIKLEYGAFKDRPYDSKAVWGNDDKIREIMRSYSNDAKERGSS